MDDVLIEEVLGSDILVVAVWAGSVVKQKFCCSLERSTSIQVRMFVIEQEYCISPPLWLEMECEYLL